MPSRPDLLKSAPSDLPRLSAYALGVYQECPRKYALRYRQNRYWPAAEGAARAAAAEKPESGRGEALERGQRFHALVQAHQLGMPTDAILGALTAEDPAMADMWQAFLAHPDARPTGTVTSEVSLHFFVREVPVMARFDRLVRNEDRWTIVDWKTGGSPKALASSWQSKLYPFALAHAGHVLNGGAAIPPAAISLRYWIWKDGAVRVMDLAYSAERYAEDLQTFEQQAAIVSAPLDAEHFPGHGPKSKACGRCSFMTLCHPLELPTPTVMQLPLPRFQAAAAEGTEPS